LAISHRDIGLLEVISKLFENGEYFGPLPVGVANIELITSETVRITFTNKVDCNMLCKIAIEKGYSIDASGYSPRIVDKGHIIARVGSRSDPGAEYNIFIYLFPTSGIMSIYMRSAAIRHKILDPKTSKLNVERLLKYNQKIIRLVERYRRSRYQDLIEKLEA